MTEALNQVKPAFGINERLLVPANMLAMKMFFLRRYVTAYVDIVTMGDEHNLLIKFLLLFEFLAVNASTGIWERHDWI